MTIPIFQVVGYKNTGKTTLVCELVKRLGKRGLKVGTVKHDAHTFELDIPGKDTWKHQQAGASQTAIISSQRSAILYDGELTLEQAAAGMTGVDIIVAEGFKAAGYPKWVLIKDPSELDLIDRVSRPVGVSTWFAYRHPTLPVLALDDYDAILECLLRAVRPTS